MKNILIKTGLIFLCLMGMFSIARSNVYAYNIKEGNYSGTTQDKEKLYQDFLTILLAPHLDSAIESYYGKTKKYSEAKIIDIKPVEKEAYCFTATFQVKTFDDNNLIGVENITVKNDNGEIEVLNFIHQDVPVKTSR